MIARVNTLRNSIYPITVLSAQIVNPMPCHLHHHVHHSLACEGGLFCKGECYVKVHHSVKVESLRANLLNNGLRPDISPVTEANAKNALKSIYAMERVKPDNDIDYDQMSVI